MKLKNIKPGHVSFTYEEYCQLVKDHVTEEDFTSILDSIVIQAPDDKIYIKYMDGTYLELIHDSQYFICWSERAENV